jgi:hypothetical protein
MRSGRVRIGGLPRKDGRERTRGRKKKSDPTRIEEPNAITNRKTDGKIRRLVELGLKVKGK